MGTRRKNVLLVDQGGRFIAPEDVGSAVQWHLDVKVSRTKDGVPSSVCLNGTIALSDCDRVIKWGLYESSYGEDHDDEADMYENRQDSLEKIDNALEELKAVRAAVVRAQTVYDKVRKQIPKGKKSE